MSRTLGIVIVLLLGYIGYAEWDRGVVAQQRDAAERERDRLAMEAATMRQSLNGWTIRYAQEVGSLQADLMERDSALAELARDYTQARAELSTYMSLVAELERDTVGLAGTVAGPAERPDSAFGTLRDAVMDAEWVFHYPGATLDFRYGLTIPLELVTAVSGDGSTVVSARSSVPGLALTVDELLVEPSPPEQVYRTPWLRSIGIGAIAGLLTAVLVR